MFCRQCSASFSDDAVFCPNCGTPVTVQPSKDEAKPLLDESPNIPLQVCTQCGTSLSDGVAFCPKCGTQTSQPQQVVDDILPPTCYVSETKGVVSGQKRST